MKPQGDEERIDERYCDGEEEGDVLIHPTEHEAQAVADPYAQRAQKEGGDRNHDDHGQEGHEDQLHAVRNDLLQSLINQGKHYNHEEGNEDVS